MDAFVLEYSPRTGEVSTSALAQCWNMAFERCSPVRQFASYRGQTNFPGWWWMATTGDHVGHESWLERDHLIVLDADPDVIGVAAQPFWIHWRDEDGRLRRHAPDFFARTRDGGAVVIDVRADERIAARDAEAFEATGRACAAVGWSYRRVGALDAVLSANLRWLSGYRHPRCLRSGLAAELLAVFAEPTKLLAGASVVGEPIVVLPTLFHLLWSQRLVIDLSSAILGPSTLVSSR
ncbi:TnsA-like heteromeric transposase endonuclease subunit [Nocardia tenerifensis]|uniref:TnsA-like heteromeric transposase endonuclease subunit n=1 Tax=Nocardia tenerifensis TaxID=228006 RepID=UPI000A06C6BF|nr:TnsA-like heteromeric transposase endonuclease subunit [Nocardia tenerifensis]